MSVKSVAVDDNFILLMLLHDCLIIYHSKRFLIQVEEIKKESRLRVWLFKLLQYI